MIDRSADCDDDACAGGPGGVAGDRGAVADLNFVKGHAIPKFHMYFGKIYLPTR